jgi:putative endonuclease
MQTKNELGRLGEELAVRFMRERGYEILERNWRYSRNEIDIIAVKDNKIHFIEVKTRKTTRYGLPEEAVSEIKIGFLLKAGEAFLFEHPEYKKVQIDVLAICMLPSEEIEYFLIEDVYY